MKLTTDQKEQLTRVAQEIGAIFIVTYGSKARGEGRADSDLDIAVLVQQKPDYALFTAVFSRISDVFRGENVDVRFLNDANPLFVMQVVRDGVLLYGDLDAYDEYRMLANRRYVDDGAKYFPFFDEYLREQQMRLQRSIV